MEGIEALNQNMVDIAEKASRAVVSINSTLKMHSYGYGIAPVKGSGSGFIITPDGYVLTNNHVVEGSEEVEVILSDGSRYTGTVAGRDPQTDVAIVKIQGSGFPVLELGDSEAIKTGSLVLAIGNALGLPGGHTVSMGVISAKNRPMPWADFIFEGLLQTDAAINPGNSGGPLVDMSGRAVGINTAIIAQANGIGFSIPVNTVKKELHDMISTGRVNRQYIGISGMEVNSSIARRYGTEADHGVMVARIDPDSPAYSSGLRPGDVIIEFGGKPVNSMRDLIKHVSEMSGSSDAVFMRGRTRYKTTITIKNKKGKKVFITD